MIKHLFDNPEKCLHLVIEKDISNSWYCVYCGSEVLIKTKVRNGKIQKVIPVFPEEKGKIPEKLLHE